jgi:uncharacterized membrane protein
MKGKVKDFIVIVLMCALFLFGLDFTFFQTILLAILLMIGVRINDFVKHNLNEKEGKK